MSEQGKEITENVEVDNAGGSNSKSTVSGSSEDNRAIEAWIDYRLTAKMRIELSISLIQQYSAMATFDDCFKAKASVWYCYYNEIKALNDSGAFEELFRVEVPSY